MPAEPVTDEQIIAAILSARGYTHKAADAILALFAPLKARVEDLKRDVEARQLAGRATSGALLASDAENESLRAQLNANCLQRDALQLNLAQSYRERNALYASNEEAQTQRVRESHANTDLASANRGLLAQLAEAERVIAAFQAARPILMPGDGQHFYDCLYGNRGGVASAERCSRLCQQLRAAFTPTTGTIRAGGAT